MKQPPDGFEIVEPTLTALENELRESKKWTLLYLTVLIF